MDETAHLTVNVTWPTHDHVTQFLGIVVASLDGRAMFARKVNDRVQYIFYSISLKPILKEFACLQQINKIEKCRLISMLVQKCPLSATRN